MSRSRSDAGGGSTTWQMERRDHRRPPEWMAKDQDSGYEPEHLSNHFQPFSRLFLCSRQITTDSACEAAFRSSTYIGSSETQLQQQLHLHQYGASRSGPPPCNLTEAITISHAPRTADITKPHARTKPVTAKASSQLRR